MKNEDQICSDFEKLYKIINPLNEESINCQDIKNYYEKHNIEKNILYKIIDDISTIKSTFDYIFFKEYISMNYNYSKFQFEEKWFALINQFEFLILEFKENKNNVNLNNDRKNDKLLEIDILHNENCITKDILEKIKLYDKSLVKNSKFDLLIKYVDIVKDNKISYNEFEKIMLGKVKTLKNLEDMAILKSWNYYNILIY